MTASGEGVAVAVTGGVTSGYQAIVAPGFLANAGQTYVLEYASKQETPEPDAVTVREVRGATREPLSLAYRVLEARADRYGLYGEDLQARAPGGHAASGCISFGGDLHADAPARIWSAAGSSQP